jgi:ABC-2 type transport system ATP-binding protein/lipopolysaccharide transport system ATP-binding protein
MSTKIEANSISLTYPIIGMAHQSIKAKVLNTATGGIICHSGALPLVQALQNISFTCKDGDRIGLIGHNGAGKSTLLKVLAGIYRPTNGSLSISGSVVSTLNISLGMENEATGLENIVIRSMLMGLSRKEALREIDDIADFTELGEYLNMPLRTYSSGMATRIAFAVATAMHADILLMDEIITTGDASFLTKAEARLAKFMGRTKIIVIASHSEAIIRKFCNKAILLQHGKLLGIGTVDEMYDKYYS